MTSTQCEIWEPPPLGLVIPAKYIVVAKDLKVAIKLKEDLGKRKTNNQFKMEFDENQVLYETQAYVK